MTAERPPNRDYAELINIAAEMVRGQNMPSPYYDDHGFYSSTPKAERKRILAIAEKADQQAKDWAMRVKSIAERIGAK